MYMIKRACPGGKRQKPFFCYREGNAAPFENGIIAGTHLKRISSAGTMAKRVTRGG